MARGDYLLDNRQGQAGQRFDALDALFNPSTFRHFEALGVGEGWRVWEVGAGGPRVARWLGQRTGERVLASDIDTTWLKEDDSFEALEHDVGVDPAPEGAFDLVHARLVLVHVPQREAALRSMVGALRPGGWILLEEADPGLQPRACLSEDSEEERLANELKRGFRSLMAERGVDLAFGRTLPRRLRDAGLVEVGADVYFPLGGPHCAELERATVEQIRGQLVERGLATSEMIDRHLAAVEAGRLDLATSPMVSAWARKPWDASTPREGT